MPLFIPNVQATAACKQAAVIHPHIVMTPTIDLRQTSRNTRTVITDADGTLWSFWFYFVPFMRHTLPWLSSVLDADEADVAKELGRVFEKTGTHEPLEPLLFTSYRRNFEYSPETFYAICDEYNDRFDKFRKENLTLFPGVQKTLTEIEQLPKKAWILTDSPLHMALRKAHELEVLDRFAGVVAMESEIPPVNDFFAPADRERLLARQRQILDFKCPAALQVATVKKLEQKPGIAGISRILKMGNLEANNCLMVGDNIAKDGGVAMALGMPFLYAAYGVILPNEYIKMVDVILNPNEGPRTDGHGLCYRPSVSIPVKGILASYEGLFDHI